MHIHVSVAFLVGLLYSSVGYEFLRLMYIVRVWCVFSLGSFSIAGDPHVFDVLISFICGHKFCLSAMP